MRGIMQIECLYHQTVRGNKTKTRRTGGLDEVNKNPDEWGIAAAGFRAMPHDQISSVLFIRKGLKRGEMTDTDSVILKPHYKIGEVLYMKEPMAIGLQGNRLYLFDHNEADIPQVYRWTNKMFMPASAARLFIQITGISCERLLDISYEDAKAEGIQCVDIEGQQYKHYQKNNCVCNPRESFLSLFRFANKLSSKKDIGNPWVFVYTYKLVPKP